MSEELINTTVENSADNTAENPELVHDPIDGKYEITIEGDFTEALLYVHSAHFGGIDITEEQVLSDLKSKHIDYGVDYALISKIFSEKLFDQLHVIAKATPPENGVDGTITYLVDQYIETKPKEDAKGFVDFKDLGIIRNIKASTVIAEITPPTEGTPGINIQSKEIPQKKGVEAKVEYGENIVLNGSRTQLVARVDGNLKYTGNKFSIETTFNLRGNVDASTGNLNFIGDIIIRGEILPGFTVSSLKSVTVYENITGVTIQAGGSVTIKKGCINSTISSHGDVNVDFCENSKITCDGDLKGDAFITCDVYAGGEFQVQGKRGIIMGGKYTCLKNLLANSIGSKSYLPTSLTVGDNAIMLEEMSECEKKLKDFDFKILRCTQAVEFLTAKKKESPLPPDKEEMLSNSIKAKIILGMERKKVEQRIENIKVYLENKQNLSITVKKELYPGTKIIINDLVFQVNDKYQFCKIYLGEDGIKTETL